MNMQIRTILSCPIHQQQKQKKTPFDRYNLRVMQGVVILNYGPYFFKKTFEINATKQARSLIKLWLKEQQTISI